MKLRPARELDARADRGGSAAAAVVGALGATFAAVAGLHASSAAQAGLHVVFSPSVQKALASGSYHLMQSVTGTMPVAVNAAGRIVEIGKVPGGLAALAAGGPGLLPILLPGVIAAAAAYASHRWLSGRLDTVHQAIESVHTRMRDDDWAALESGHRVADLVASCAGRDVLAHQLRLELAVARHDVERVFMSRRYYVEREVLAIVKSEADGRANPWTDKVKKIFAAKDLDLELGQYLEALVARARLTVATASAVALDGDPELAMQFVSDAEHQLTKSYQNLHHHLSLLAAKRPNGDWMPVVGDDYNSQWKRAKAWRAALDDHIGAELPKRNAPVELYLPPRLLKGSLSLVGAAA